MLFFCGEMTPSAESNFFSGAPGAFDDVYDTSAKPWSPPLHSGLSPSRLTVAVPLAPSNLWLNFASAAATHDGFGAGGFGGFGAGGFEFVQLPGSEMVLSRSSRW